MDLTSSSFVATTAGDPLVDACDVAISYGAGPRRTVALDGVDLKIWPGEIVGVVGESGSGKSTLAMALGRLLPTSANLLSGSLQFAGRDLFSLNSADLRQLRRTEVAFIFQDPIGTLDPTMRVGRQMNSLARLLASKDNLTGLLEMVGLIDHTRVLKSFPHQLSGGMAQRVSIAMALLSRPRLLIADEPTAALDASIRGQVLNLIVELARTRGMALMLLSHDLRSVQAHCDRVAVMYGGRVVEVGPADLIFHHPCHPYTAALLRAQAGNEEAGGRLEPIAGNPVALRERAAACSFAPRCKHAIARCASERPLVESLERRDVVCLRAAELALS